MTTNKNTLAGVLTVMGLIAGLLIYFGTSQANVSGLEFSTSGNLESPVEDKIKPIAAPVNNTVTLKLGPIKNIGSVSHIIKALVKAKSGDTIIIDINSPGGKHYVLEALTSTIKSTRAKVVMKINIAAYSAAALVTCYADKIIATDENSHVMFHRGKLDQKAFDKLSPEQQKKMDKLMTKITLKLLEPCKKFLTDYEIRAIMIDRLDYYIDGKDWADRVNGGNNGETQS